VDDLRAQRRAGNETSFRTVNEAIAAGRPLADAEQPVGFVCECARVGCTVVLELTCGEYRTVRSDPRRFVVAPGHEAPDLERVVSRREGWTLVEKVGEAASVAERGRDGERERDATPPEAT
jgi:hypothetical protein